MLADELAPDNIRVNCVAPGHIAGPVLDEYFAWNAERRHVSPGDGRGRDRRPERPAPHRHARGDRRRPCVFFASDLARGVTGAEPRRELRPDAQLMLLSGRVAIVGRYRGARWRRRRAPSAREGAAVVLGDPSEAALAMSSRRLSRRRRGPHRDDRSRGQGDGERLVRAALDAFGQLDVLVGNARHRRPGALRGRRSRPLAPGARHDAVRLARARPGGHPADARVADRGSIVFVSAACCASRPSSRGPGAGRLRRPPHGLPGPGPRARPGRTSGSTRSCPGPPTGASTVGEPAGDPAADAVVFLASDLAAVVTGQSLDVRTTTPG